MKNVAVISRHAVPNYGSLLQSLALQISVQKIGHNPFYIDAEYCYYSAEKIAKIAMSTSKYRKIPLLNAVSYCAKIKRYRDSIPLFRQYQKKWLTLSDKSFRTEEELYNNIPCADIYLVGSDQVWNIMPDGKISNTYFLPMIKNKETKISYAASFGSVEKIKDEMAHIYEMLKDFKCITVREDNGLAILDSIGLTGTQVVDPTLLVPSSIWSNYMEIPQKKINNYLLVYQVNRDKEICQYAKKLAEHLNVEIIRLSNDATEKNWGEGFVYLPSPGEFLYYLKNATYILTDSFHGTCFSIMFHKQFVDIYPERYSQRNQSILRLAGLTNRVINKKWNVEQADLLLRESINWTDVDQKLDSERIRCMNVLKEMIED